MFNQLRYFISVVKNNNFTKAAEECHISQPAISQQIRDLESNIGVKLLNRNGRTFSVTPAGEYLFQHGQDIIDSLDDVVKQTQIIGRGKQDYVLRIGYLRTFGTKEFLQAVAEFSSAYPDVQVKIIGSDHEGLYSMLKQDELELAFSDLRRAASNKYVNYLLTQSYFQVVINKELLPEYKTEIDNRALEDLPCILVVGPNEIETEKEYYRDILGIRSKFLRADTFDEASAMMAARQGYLVINDRRSQEVANPTFKQLTLLNGGQKMKQEYYAFWKADNSGYYIETFAEMLKKQFDK